MDELELIRRFRADVPAPSRSARDRALRALRAEQRSRKPAPLRRRSRALLPAAGFAAAAGAAAMIVLGSSGDGLTPAARAAQHLRQAATVAERQPDPRAIGPDQFWYQRSLEAYLATQADRNGGAPFSILETQIREVWIGRDGGGRIRTRGRGEPRFPGPRDRERWEAAGSPSGRGDTDLPLANGDAGGSAPGFFLGAEPISYDDLRSLPSDPDRLYTRLRQAAGGDARQGGGQAYGRLFRMVGDLLRGAPLSSGVRAALYRVAARIGGIRFLGEMRDGVGRRGIGIGRDDQGVRHVLIFDPHTAELIGEQEILLERAAYVDARPGAVIGEAAYLDARVVDSTRERR